MMPPDKDEGNYTDLARYRLEASERDIADAKVLLDIGSYNNSASRSYYAVFHAISAIHALDKNAYKRHKDTIGNFNKDYINNGVFPREYGKKIIKAEKLRHNSDYGNFYVTTQEDAQEQLDFAIEFCDKVKWSNGKSYYAGEGKDNSRIIQPQHWKNKEDSCSASTN